MNKWLDQSKFFIKRNSSTILTCVGAVGVVLTGVMAAKATPKALAMVEDAKEEKGEELTKFETVLVAGPAYIPAIVTGAATIACVFGANILNKRQQAAMASAYALLDNSYKEYRKKVTELYGEEADRHVKEEMAKDNYENELYPEDDKVLFYDFFSERYFTSTMADVLRAELHINKRLVEFGGAFLNDFYDMVGLERVDYGDYLGWAQAEMLESTWEPWLDFDHQKTDVGDNLECYIITMSHEPTPDFYDY